MGMRKRQLTKTGSAGGTTTTAAAAAAAADATSTGRKSSAAKPDGSRRRDRNNNNNNRNGNRHTAGSSAEPTPEDILADSQLYHQDDRPFWKRKRFHFVIGVSVGALAMLGAASTTPAAQSHLNELQAYLALQLADLDLGGASDIVDDFLGNVTGFLKPPATSDIPFMPALAIRSEFDLKPHFPVVLIPGIVSSGLESWGTSEKSQKYFRKRMWGTTTMFKSVLLDKESWTQHVKLDPVTGLDPPGIKIRAAQGLDAADYFVTGYWVWARIIENLAAIGYDTNNMYLASYDWRLSFSNLEVRDGYFTRLRSSIETFRRIHNRKVVVVAHSMGSNLFPYFLKWVESPVGGNAGSSWTEDHIETFANIAGPMVGVPKAMTAFLSGETRDTMALGSFGAYLLEKFFSRRERASLMRSWAGGASMLPKGGELFWGSVEQAPDDPTDSYMLGNHPSYGSMLSFIGNKIREKNSTIENKTDAAQSVSGPAKQTMSSRHLTVAGAMSLLHENTSEDFQTMLRTNYSYGITTSKSQLEKNDNDFTKWSNSLESKLPDAPSMKIFCMYGSGLPTERSYYYAEASNEQSETCSKEDEDCEDADDDVGQDPLQQAENIGLSVTSTANDILNPPELYIDATAHDPDNNVRTGIRFSDGDGTVPLLSLGYMCAPSGGWRKHADLYNPSHIPVVVREYKNEVSESSFDVRGGKKAGDHVDILGNWEMVTDILRLVSNQAENVTERILSDIERYAANIRLIPEP